MSDLVDSKCLAALKKLKCGIDKAAIALAKQAEEIGATKGSTTLDFVTEENPADADWIASLTITVSRVG